MKQLQNNFTTPEQSKRLLELGVPSDSADQVYYDDFMWGAHEFIPNDRIYSEIVAGHENISLPCWSVGRLMEIFEICDIMPEETKNNMCCIPSIKRMSYMEYMIKCFTKAIEMKILDFSKLEE